MGFHQENGNVGVFPRNTTQQGTGYPAPKTGMFSPLGKKKNDGAKDLHMFVRSSSASPVLEGGIHVFREVLIMVMKMAELELIKLIFFYISGGHQIEPNPKEFEEYR